MIIGYFGKKLSGIAKINEKINRKYTYLIL